MCSFAFPLKGLSQGTVGFSSQRLFFDARAIPRFTLGFCVELELRLLSPECEFHPKHHHQTSKQKNKKWQNGKMGEGMGEGGRGEERNKSIIRREHEAESTRPSLPALDTVCFRNVDVCCNLANPLATSCQSKLRS